MFWSISICMPIECQQKAGKKYFIKRKYSLLKACILVVKYKLCCDTKWVAWGVQRERDRSMQFEKGKDKIPIANWWMNQACGREEK